MLKVGNRMGLLEVGLSFCVLINQLSVKSWVSIIEPVVQIWPLGPLCPA